MKRWTHFAARALSIYFIITILSLPFIFVTPVSAAPMFEDDFETGDFSKWDNTGGSIAVTSGDAYQGDYKAVLDAADDYAQAIFTLAPRDHVFMRAYVMFKAFPESGRDTAILGVYNMSGRYMAEAEVVNDAGTVKWALRYWDNDTHHIATSELVKPVLNTWYCVEVEGKSNTTTGSESRIYIDNQELTDVQQIGINNDAQINCGYIWDSNVAVERWYDCVVVDFDYIGVENNSSTVDAGGPYTVNEGSSVTVTATGNDPDGDTLDYAWDLDNDDIFETSGQSVSFSGVDGPADVTIATKVTNTSGAIGTATTTVHVNNVAPVVTISGPDSGLLYKIGDAVKVIASFTDLECDNPWAVDVNWDDTTHDKYNAAAAGSLTIPAKIFSSSGVYTISVTVTDKDGDSGTKTVMVIVYDPDGGFVTGGGWINSAAGAYIPDPTLAGIANFGFVSKYKKGADAPVGQTEFQFQVANLNFHSELYQWLVVAGPKAQYKGTGTINGVAAYTFLLTATDGQINGGGGVDKFRIKITKTSDGALVYDNVLGASDDVEDANPQVVGSGSSIVIHK